MSRKNSVTPWAEAPAELLRQLRGIFFDIDDTFSSEGKIHAEAYSALWRAHALGLLLVPVTGRPGAWADLIARMWPVDGVVAENGAMATFMRHGALRSIFINDDATRAKNRQRLHALRELILREVPGAGVASDQDYRLFDLAIDFCEDVPALAPSAVQKIVEIFHDHGATAKVSSIHVNGWFGDYDKLGMCRRFANDILQVDLDAENANFIFVGDSPNDAPMFHYFSNSVGVANLMNFADQLSAWPRFVTQGHSGKGFVQVVDRLCAARKVYSGDQPT